MTIVSISYHHSGDIDNPEDWFRRLRVFIGSWELIGKQHGVIRIERINYEGRLNHRSIEYHFIPSRKYSRYWPWKLHRLIRSLKPDIVTVHGLHYPLQTIQLRLQLPSHVRIIAQHHAEKPFIGIRKYFQRLASNYVDAYLFASKKMGERWVARGNISTAKKVYEVMEVSSVFEPMERVPARKKTGARGDPVFLWVGRLDQNKDPLTMVKAFIRFCEYRPSARLIMIYHTSEMLTELEDVLAIERTQQVHLAGSIPHEDMKYWYNSADFVVSTSRYEGSGTAVCEAMSCGCIPILTNIDSFRAITGEFQCGLEFEPGDVEGLLEKLLLASQLDRQVERRKSIERFKQALSFEAIAEKIQSIADSLIETRR